MRTTSVRATIALLAGLVLLAGCGSSTTPRPEPAGAQADATTTEAADATTTAPYASDGPYDVGFTELHLADGRRVVVWYPADAEAFPGDGAPHQQVEWYGALRSDLLDRVPQAGRVPFRTDAALLAAPATIDDGAPLVLYAHPYAAVPEMSATTMIHLASWGFVVAAPDQVERSASGLYGDAAAGVTPRTDDEVLSATIDLLAEASVGDGQGDPADVLTGLVDTDRLAVTGASQGANVAYGFASADPRVDGWISYSGGFGGDLGPAPATPKVPGMVMLADRDQAIAPNRTKVLYAQMTEPKYLVHVYDAGHEVFTDVCHLGGADHGMVDVAERHQILPQQLLDLAKDGCQPELPPVEQAQPAIGQASVAFLRWVFGIDDQPIGLTTDAVARLGTPTTITKD